MWAMIDSSNASSHGMLKTIIGAVAVVAFLGIVFFFARNSGGGEAPGIILFYGEGCPHCATVDAFIEENDVEAKVPFIRKEVFNNRRNARAMADFSKKCGLPTEGMGVPFLWTGTTCVTGDKDIMKFFESRISVAAQASSPE